MALLDEVARGREPGWGAADDGDFLPGRGCFRNVVEIEVLLLVVRNEAFEIADAQRVNFFPHETGAFAVILLRTDAAGDGGEYVVFADLGRSAHEVSGHD